jgi:sec-independent protein translocase protein TatA
VTGILMTTERRPIRQAKRRHPLFTSILQPTHLLIILIVALVVLGPKRLPDAGRALGQGLKEFRSSISGEHSEDQIAPAPAVTQAEDSPGAQASKPSRTRSGGS